MTVTDPSPRAHLVELITAIDPWDDVEHAHQADAIDWITDGTELYRTDKPDTPPKHLVSYFVLLDEPRRRLLLVAHRKAGLWLPTGGHVEPLEDPWRTVVRECHEELATAAVPSALTGPRPFFLTITQTRGHGTHTDVSLWYLLTANADDVTSFDTGEFEAITWLSPNQILDQPAAALDPHMHRFTHKLLATTAITPAGV